MKHTFPEPAQQQVWETVVALNAAWTFGDPDAFSEYFHPRMVAITPVDRERRLGAERCIAGWKGFREATHIHRFDVTEPVVEVFGEAAVVSYYYDMSFDMNGQTINTGGRDLFFLVREAGRWWVVADQFSPYPPS
ncbi:YybH family protein [Niveibacterium microcysteis]|uniref:Nuclear transport factor 2 family protein n=1 Tax=Niveibacterium microcysteis TaxID=2811415 RepID=A0ABX7M3I4_9RHOO|nr:nuclear transport factor 2 family protein [Niveibacterium microcysteis]QSI76314.1 nuclear transport factor 2 family protein [Niveibacterium microcysteis]